MSNDALINELAEIYLKESRVNKDDTSIKPFTEEAISYAMEKSDRIPGRFLRLLYLMIEKAVQNNWDTIDKDKVDLAWKESNKNYSTQPTTFDDAPLAETKTEL